MSKKSMGKGWQSGSSCEWYVPVIMAITIPLVIAFGVCFIGTLITLVGMYCDWLKTL